MEKQTSASNTLKHSAVVVPEEYPTQIQDTIAHVQPMATYDIIHNKHSKFIWLLHLYNDYHVISSYSYCNLLF